MSAVAERYAAALADVALERKSGEAIRKDLAAFVETFLGSADLRNALESPAVDGAVKNKVISAIAAKMGLNEAVRNFVCLIVQHRRSRATHRAANAQHASGAENGAFARMRSKVAREEALGQAKGELLGDDIDNRLHALEREQKIDALLGEIKARKGLTG